MVLCKNKTFDFNRRCFSTSSERPISTLIKHGRIPTELCMAKDALFNAGSPECTKECIIMLVKINYDSIV